MDEEVGLELKSNSVDVPIDISHDFSVDLVWKSASFDCTQNAMKIFAANESAVSIYLYHKLLGHEIEDPVSRMPLPKQYALSVNMHVTYHHMSLYMQVVCPQSAQAGQLTGACDSHGVATSIRTHPGTSRHWENYHVSIYSLPLGQDLPCVRACVCHCVCVRAKVLSHIIYVVGASLSEPHLGVVAIEISMYVSGQTVDRSVSR